MPNMRLKEKIFYGFICNEGRVYKYCYTRLLPAGLDLERSWRVVGRIPKWRNCCAERKIKTGYHATGYVLIGDN